MAKTGEGGVKERIDKLLKAAPYCKFTKPVVGPYGETMLDYVGCSKGRYFEIEAKKPGVKNPTERQQMRMDGILSAGGTAFFINGEQEQLDALEAWLHSD